MLIRFGKKQGINKKKDAKVAGLEIATQVGAHVAQVVGHTVLLYRPANPPLIDLDAAVAEADGATPLTEAGDGIEG